MDASLKEAILKDKPTMSTKELQEKYSLSRSTIQRVKLPDLSARAEEFRPTSNKQTTQTANLVERILKEEVKPQREEPKPQPTPDALQRILLLADTFPAHYPFITDKTAFISSLNEKSPHQLTDLLKTMEATKSINNLSNQMKQVFFVSSRAVETLGSRIRLKTNGLTDALLQQQQELDYIFKELAITYGDKFGASTRPELKLVMMFGMTLLSVDSSNRIREHLKPEETYRDL